MNGLVMHVTLETHCLFGFIRELESSLLYQIPLIIIQLILCYHDSSDKWDTECIADNSQIIDKSLIRCNSRCLGAVSLSRIISSNKYKWKFHIINIDQIYLFDIGVYSINDIPSPDPKIVWRNKYITNAIELIYGSQIRRIKKMGVLFTPKCSNGDIIEMILDLNELTLNYSINGKTYKIAHGVPKESEYKAYICMNYGGLPGKAVINLLQSNYI